MAAIKPIDQSNRKWSDRAGVAGDAYNQGIDAPRTPWAQAAGAADAIYRTRVTAAANAGRYAGGIRRAGEDKWKSNAKSKGTPRFPEGVAIAARQGTWTEGFQPYQAAIAALALPPRGATVAANLARVTAVATALQTLRERRAAGG